MRRHRWSDKHRLAIYYLTGVCYGNNRGYWGTIRFKTIREVDIEEKCIGNSKTKQIQFLQFGFKRKIQCLA